MHPILFYITDSFYISTYGVMVVLGLLAALWLAGRQAHRAGFDPNLVVDVALAGVLAGFVGGRAAFIATEWPQFLESPGAFIFSRSGFVFLGGLIAGVGAGAWVLRRRIPGAMWAFGDVVAPAVPLGHFFGRLGCFFTGCCHGDVCEAPLGVRFPEVINRRGEIIGSMAYLTYPDPAHPHWSLPVWPTQLFEAGLNLAICAVLLAMVRRRRFDGQIILLYGFLYGAVRFALEFLRGDAERGVFFGGALSTSQIIILLVLPALVWMWHHRRRRGLTPLPLAGGEAESGGAPRRTPQSDRSSARSGGADRPRRSKHPPSDSTSPHSKS
ncbi:MAG: hypothetical protein Kow0059_05590 [Candidatus Sumerlaeia bacterium]